MKVSELIKEKYDKLDRNDIGIFSFIMQNKKDFVDKNLKDFANMTDFSQTAIVNFAKKIGLEGYAELKYLIKWEDGKIVDFDEEEIENTYNDILITMNIIKTMNLDYLFEKLEESKNIYVIYSGYIQENLAEELKRNFLNIGKIITKLDTKRDIDFLNRKLNEKDLIFVISFSGENKVLLDFLKNIRKKVFTVSLTKMSNNKIARLTNLNLSFVSHEVYRYEKNTSISPVSQYYLIVDFLVLKYLNYKSLKKSRLKNWQDLIQYIQIRVLK